MQGFSASLAIAIGIDNYTNHVPRLEAAVADATMIGQTLEQKHGYKVQLVQNEQATLDGMRSLLQGIPDQVDEWSRLFFYFAGHGVVHNDNGEPTGYLLPQSADRDNVSSFLPMQELHDALLALPCKHVFIVLDCCSAGAFRWTTTRALRVQHAAFYKEHYAGYIRFPAWQLLTSAAYDEKALDVAAGEVLGKREVTEGHSPFALALHEGLSGAADGYKRGVVTATGLYSYVRAHFEDMHHKRQATANYQTPGMWPLSKHDRGEYLFLVPNQELDLDDAPAFDEDNSPYRGLKVYRQEDSDHFFGREEVLRSLEQHVRTNPLTVLLGPSGTGKSSLVRAGLLPRLAEADAKQWHILDILRPGERPLTNLLAVLPPVIQDGNTEDGHPRSLDAWLRSWNQSHPQTAILLVVDQLEELFSLCRSEAERKEFLAQLAQALDGHPGKLRIVATMRSDFEPQFLHLLQSPASSLTQQAWDEGRFHLRSMSQDELREVILGPAQLHALYFEPASLVDDLINEVVLMPGALPLLSFALNELYMLSVAARLEEMEEDRSLKKREYDKLGGVTGALQKRATEEYERLSPPEKKTLQRLLLRLVSTEGGELARRRALYTELEFGSEEENRRIEKVREQFINARLLVSGGEKSDRNDDRYVEPAHDVLVRGWPQISSWIDAEETRSDDLIFQRRTTRAALEWQAAQPQDAEENQKESTVAQVWDELRSRLRQIVAGPGAPAQTGLLWTDESRSSLLKVVLDSPSRAWLNRVESEFARASIARRQLNLRIRNTAISLLAVLTIAATVAASVATNRLVAAENQRGETLLSQSRALTGLARTQLNVDPVAAIQLSLLALPSGATPRPYLPQAEAVLHQALRLSRERYYREVTAFHGTYGKTRNQVAFHPQDDFPIAVGGTGLRLLDQNLADMVVLVEEDVGDDQEDPNKIVENLSWNPAGTLLFGTVDKVEAWMWHLDGAQSSWVSESQLDGIAWHPSRPEVLLRDGDVLLLWNGKDVPLPVADVPGLEDAAWSPTGDRLFAWDWSGSVFLWDMDQIPPEPIPTEAKLLETQDGEEFLEADGVRFDQKGNTAAILYANGVILLLDLTDGSVRGTIREHQVAPTDEESDAGFLPVSGDHFFTWGGGKVILRAADGERLAELSSPSINGAIGDVVWNPEQERLLIHTDRGQVLLVDDTLYAISLEGHIGPIQSVAWHDTYVATGGADGTIRVWNTETGKQIAILRGHKGVREGRTDVWGIRWRSDGSLVSYGEDGTFRIWQVFDEDDKEACERTTSGNTECFGFGRLFGDGSERIDSANWLGDDEIVASADGTAFRWRFAEQSFDTMSPPNRDATWTATWDPYGQTVLFYVKESDAMDTVPDSQLWDFASNSQIAVIPGPIQTVHLLEDAWLVSGKHGQARIIDSRTGDVRLTLANSTIQINGAALRGDRLATADHDGAARIWNAATGTLSQTLKPGSANGLYLEDVVWLDDQHLLVGGAGGVWLWDTSQEAPLCSLSEPGSVKTFAVLPAAHAPDNITETVVAVAGEQVYGLIFIDESNVCRWTGLGESRDEPFLGIAWAQGPPWPDQDYYAPIVRWLPVQSRLPWRNLTETLYLITWGGDGTIRYWHITAEDEDWIANEVWQAYAGDKRALQKAAISPDGTRILGAGGNIGLRVWDVHRATPAYWRTQASGCGYSTRLLSEDQRKAFGVEGAGFRDCEDDGSAK